MNVGPATLLKKETLAQVFSCEFYDISKNTLFTEHLWATASVMPSSHQIGLVKFDVSLSFFLSLKDIFNIMVIQLVR